MPNLNLPWHILKKNNGGCFVFDKNGNSVMELDNIEHFTPIYQAVNSYEKLREALPEVFCSTGLDDNPTYGYGRLDEFGFFEHPLTEQEYKAVKQYHDIAQKALEE